MVDRSKRSIEREKAKMEREKKKYQAEIKKLALKGQHVSMINIFINLKGWC